MSSAEALIFGKMLEPLPPIVEALPTDGAGFQIIEHHADGTSAKRLLGEDERVDLFLSEEESIVFEARGRGRANIKISAPHSYVSHEWRPLREGSYRLTARTYQNPGSRIPLDSNGHVHFDGAAQSVEAPEKTIVYSQ